MKAPNQNIVDHRNRMLAHSKGEAAISTRLARKAGPNDKKTGDEISFAVGVKKRKVDILNEKDQHDTGEDEFDKAEDERDEEEDEDEDTDSAEEVEIDWDNEAYWEQLRRREEREERRKRKPSDGKSRKKQMSPRARAELEFVLQEGKRISDQGGLVGAEQRSKKSSYLNTVHKV